MVPGLVAVGEEGLLFVLWMGDDAAAAAADDDD